MKRSVRIVIPAALCVTVLAISMAPLAVGQVKKGKERPLLTEQLMKGLVAPNCGALKKALDAGPADDEAWDAVALHAALLNEASYIVMADDRCPDGNWAGAAETLRGCSQAVLAAAAAKDADAGKAAFGELTKACGACHKAHKKE
jgi:cytochrome c556